MRKRIVSTILAIIMAVAGPTTVFAKTEAELRAEAQALAEQANAISEKKAESNAALSNTEEAIGTNEAALSVLTDEITALDAQLVQLMSDIDVLQAEIETTRGQIEVQTVALADAEDTRDQQYADMKKRIQYLYENNDNMSLLAYVASAENLTDFLNRVDSVMQLQSYDREQLIVYQQSVYDTQQIKNELEITEGMLVEEEIVLEQQQTELNEVLEEKRARSDDYDAEIAALREKADALSAQVAAQNAELSRVLAEQQAAEAEANRLAEEERKAKEEAERKAREAAAREAAEAEAARQAEAQQQAAQQQAAQQSAPQQTAAPAAAPTAPRATGDKGAYAAQLASTYASGPYRDRAIRMNQQMAAVSRPGIGQEVANFAASWCGRTPYVVAGESLTGGADCAGFVKAVHAHFGIQLERNLDLYTMLGKPVSQGEMQPGDIIVYYGHVAIYMGNDRVCHARSPQIGTEISVGVNYRPILAIRRFFCYD